MTEAIKAEPRAATPVRPKESALWSFALLALVAVAVGNELVILVPGVSPGFLYVTIKFVLLPAWSLVVVGTLLAGLIGDRHPPIQAWLAGATATIYLVSLFYWPLPWLP